MSSPYCVALGGRKNAKKYALGDTYTCHGNSPEYRGGARAAARGSRPDEARAAETRARSRETRGPTPDELEQQNADIDFIEQIKDDEYRLTVECMNNVTLWQTLWQEADEIVHSRHFDSPCHQGMRIKLQRAAENLELANAEFKERERLGHLGFIESLEARVRQHKDKLAEFDAGVTPESIETMFGSTSLQEAAATTRASAAQRVRLYHALQQSTAVKDRAQLCTRRIAEMDRKYDPV